MLNKIGFIGAGNMSTSLIGGLIADGISGQQIWASDKDSEKLDRLSAQFAINCCEQNAELVAQVDVLVFAVKPQVLKSVATEISAVVREHRPLSISIAAGVRADDLDKWLGQNNAVVRCMPNTPAMLQCAATALFANTQVTDEQKNIAESVMRAVGITVWLQDEALMDAVTALSGSGPAYFFLLMESMEKAGVKMGLPHEVASLLTMQTAFGAAKMALESTENVETLRKFVTSPGGTTEQAINVLQQNNIQQLFYEALAAAKSRSAELADQLGEN